MKRKPLPKIDHAWLAETFARNRVLYGGWSMKDGGDGGGDGGDAGAGGDDGSSGDSADDTGSSSDKGFPENTKPDDMTVDQRAAYYQHQARRHEERNKALLAITGGKYGDDLAAELADLRKIRDANLTDAQRAVEEAKREALAEATKSFGTKLAAAEFRAALAHVDGERRDQIIEGLSLEKYLTESGDVDTDKVKSYAATIAPADKGTGGGSHDFGAGRRGGTAAKSGVSAGAEMYRSSRKKSSSTT